MPSRYAIALIGLTSSLALVAPFAASLSELAPPQDGVLTTPAAVHVISPALAATGAGYPGF